MQSAANYKTLKGLLKAAEKVVSMKFHESKNVCGGSPSMWLHNAKYIAETKFNDTSSVQNIMKNYSITRPQDLKGGHSCFGVPLPKREYQVDDNIPGVGLVAEVYGDQLKINGQWFSKRCFETEF